MKTPWSSTAAEAWHSGRKPKVDEKKSMPRTESGSALSGDCQARADIKLRHARVYDKKG